MRNIVVELSPAEQRIVTWLTKVRQKNDRNAGAKATFYSHAEDSKFETTRMGYGAEFAFCKLFNLYPDMTTHVRKGGADAEWHGYLVDVKCVSKFDFPLMVKKGREEKADLWVLMYGDFPRYTLRGYTTTQELTRDKYLKDIKKFSGETYVMSQDDLYWLDQTDHFSYRHLKGGEY